MTPKRKLFGTDGVRGVAGEVLTAELALALGRAATAECEAARPQVLIVRDTRESGEMLEAALAAGIAAAGGDALLGRRAADAGRVDPRPPLQPRPGRRRLGLPQPLPRQRDQVLRRRRDEARRRGRGGDRGGGAARRRRPGAVGRSRARKLEGALDDYLRELRGHFPLDLSGRRVLLDCANGATYRAAPAIFERLGAEVETIADRARRAQHQRRLRLDPHRAPRRADDGPATPTSASPSTATATACSRSTRGGRVHDGDELIALAAAHLRDAGELDGGVAVTVMTNYGFHRAMEEAGDRGRRRPGRRPLRARGAARARLDAGRRAVRPPHLDRVRADRRRDRRGAADAAGARRRRPRRRQAVREAAAAARERRGRRSRRRRRRSGGLGGRRARGRGARGPRPRAGAAVGHRAAGARDGRGAERGRVRAGLRPPRRGASSRSWRIARPAQNFGRSHLPLFVYVRHRRIRGRPAVPGPARRRAREARVPRL